MKNISTLLILCGFASGLAGAGKPRPKLTVAAAADLFVLAGPLQEAFSEAELVFSFSSSGMLAHQIEAGAPFDVFLSANREYVEQLVTRGKAHRDDVAFYAIGRLGIWSKSGNIQTLDDFAKFSQLTIAIANPQHAPYGIAAKQVLEKTGIWQRHQSGVVYAGNVRQAVQFAESGNADVTIAAWSLLYDREATLVPGDLHAPIHQVGVIVRGTKQRKLAQKFMDLLTSAEGKRILTSRGFFLPAYAPSLKR